MLSAKGELSQLGEFIARNERVLFAPLFQETVQLYTKRLRYILIWKQESLTLTSMEFDVCDAPDQFRLRTLLDGGMRFTESAVYWRHSWEAGSLIEKAVPLESRLTECLYADFAPGRALHLVLHWYAKVSSWIQTPYKKLLIYGKEYKVNYEPCNYDSAPIHSINRLFIMNS